MYQQYIWCQWCERAFEISLPCKPDIEEDSILLFAVDFEKQVGEEIEGRVYPQCPYKDCMGLMMDFFFWENVRRDYPEVTLPEVPEKDKFYSPRIFKEKVKLERQHRGERLAYTLLGPLNLIEEAIKLLEGNHLNWLSQEEWGENEVEIHMYVEMIKVIHAGLDDFRLNPN